MNSVTMSDIFNMIEMVCKQRMPEDIIPYIPAGGWEGWMQVELSMFCLRNQIDVKREQIIYKDETSKVDLLFNDSIIPFNANTTNDNRMRIAIEIKCQSIYYNQQEFANLVERDINKLKKLNSNRYDRCMIIFVVDELTYQYFRENGFCDVYKGDNIAVLKMVV